MKKKDALLCSLFAMFFLFIVIPVWGSGLDNRTEKPAYRVPEIKSKVRVDGILNENVWQEALVLELNFEVEPGENIKPPVKTEVLLAYGLGHLHVAFRAYDPNPSEIRAHLTDRDNIWEDDYVGIVLDPFNDSRRTFNFYCNPFGIQADQLISMIMFGSGNDWDAIWNSAGRINNEGYTVEMAIPFSSLRFPRKKGDQIWRIDAVRNYPRNLTHLTGLFPRDRSNNCYMCQADKIIGFSGAKPGRNIEFDPTLSTLLTRERESFPDGKFIKEREKIDPGFTFRWSFTPNLTLNAAVNPDFSHIEADAAQLDINTAFALFYPEKRPFFLEGGSIFNSRFYAIYTRTIADPDWGIKVAGKEGTHAIGFFSVRDSITNFLFPASQSSQSTSLDISNISTALRYRKDVGKSSFLGAVITDREGEDYFNRLAGIDGFIRFTKKDRLLFQFLGSQTRYPDQVVSEYQQPEGKFTGTAFDALYVHSTKNVVLYTTYQNITSNFRADLGFVEQVDNIWTEVGGTYIWRHNPGHWYTRISVGGAYRYAEDHNNNLLYKRFQASFNYDGPLQSHFHIDANMGKRTFMGMEFDDRTLNFFAEIRPSGSLFMRIGGNVGDQVDFYNVQPGKRLSFNPIIQYKVGRHLYVGVDHIFERLEVNAGRLYKANLSNIRLIYQISRRAFLRTILQYADFNYNSALYRFEIDPVFRHLFSQILFSYKINPQTVLFLGYSDDYYGYRYVPLKHNNYTFFLKIGYALVL